MPGKSIASTALRHHSGHFLSPQVHSVPSLIGLRLPLPSPLALLSIEASPSSFRASRHHGLWHPSDIVSTSKWGPKKLDWRNLSKTTQSVATWISLPHFLIHRPLEGLGLESSLLCSPLSRLTQGPSGSGPLNCQLPLCLKLPRELQVMHFFV